MNDPRITGVVQVPELSITVSEHRPPAEADKVAGITVFYWDTLNKNAYLSSVGGDWEYLATKGIREQVYIGTFDKASSGVPLGEYDAASTGIGFGVNENLEHYRVISELRSGDKLFVGTKQLNVTSIAFASAQYTVFGDWEDDFSGLTFDASESIYYSRSALFVPETIWTGNVSPSSANQSLNAGKKFSDYEFLTFRASRYGNFFSTVPLIEFTTREVRVEASTRSIGATRVNDTTWRTTGGSTGITLLEIKGLKVV